MPVAQNDAVLYRFDNDLCFSAGTYGVAATTRDADAAKWACDVATYLIQRMLYQAGQYVADGAFGTAQLRVLRIIRETGEISRTELCRKTQDMTPRERDAILTNLEACGRIEVIKKKTTTKSKEVYRAL